MLMQGCRAGGVRKEGIRRKASGCWLFCTCPMTWGPMLSTGRRVILTVHPFLPCLRTAGRATPPSSTRCLSLFCSHAAPLFHIPPSFPPSSIPSPLPQDPFNEDDWESYTAFTQKDLAQIVGDDLLCTNPVRVQKAIDTKACNALLLKVGCWVCLCVAGGGKWAGNR